jgi:hypothetical protein
VALVEQHLASMVDAFPNSAETKLVLEWFRALRGHPQHSHPPPHITLHPQGSAASKARMELSVPPCDPCRGILSVCMCVCVCVCALLLVFRLQSSLALRCRHADVVARWLRFD